jgi:DNA-binding response OmpR family regulator
MDSQVAAALKERLTRGGYTATYMPSGTEARWSLFSVRYDALVVSLEDPASKGLDLIGDVSKHRRLPPVYALAGEDRRGVEEAEGLGATCVLESSSGLSETADAVYRLLR